MRLRDAIKDERGTLESGLTLIPLTILFMLTSQLIFLAQWGNWQRATHQSSTDSIAIRGTDGADPSSNDAVRYEPLVGGGYLVVSKRTTPIPLIANFTLLQSEARSDGNSSGSKLDTTGPSSYSNYSDVVTSLSEVFTR